MENFLKILNHKMMLIIIFKRKNIRQNAWARIQVSAVWRFKGLVLLEAKHIRDIGKT
jgi:hypothetical protein